VLPLAEGKHEIRVHPQIDDNGTLAGTVESFPKDRRDIGLGVHHHAIGAIG
jgi:hypothetical protein